MVFSFIRNNTYSLFVLLATAPVAILLTWPGLMGELDRDTGFQWLMILDDQSFLVYPHHPLIIEALWVYNLLLPSEPSIVLVSIPYQLAFALTVLASFAAGIRARLTPWESMALSAILLLNPAFLFQLNTLDDNLFVWPFLIFATTPLVERRPSTEKDAFLSTVSAGLACALGTTALGWALAIGVAWLLRAWRENYNLLPWIAGGTITGVIPIILKDIALGLPPHTSFAAMFLSPSETYFGNFGLSLENTERGFRLAATGLLSSIGPYFIDPLTMVNTFDYPFRRNTSILIILLFLMGGFLGYRQWRRNNGRFDLASPVFVVPAFYLSYIVFSADDALQERSDWIGPWVHLMILMAMVSRDVKQPKSTATNKAIWILLAFTLLSGLINGLQMLGLNRSYASPEWRVSSIYGKNAFIRDGSFLRNEGLLEFGRILAIRIAANRCNVFEPPLGTSDHLRPISLPWSPLPGQARPSIESSPDKCRTLPLERAQELYPADISNVVLPAEDFTLLSGILHKHPRNCKGLASYLYQCNRLAFVRVGRPLPQQTMKQIQMQCAEKQQPYNECMPDDALDCMGTLMCIGELYE